MEYAQPISLETPDLKIKKSKKINEKDNQFIINEIKMEMTNKSIIFKSEIINGIINTKYCNTYNYETLKKNNLFTLQENIEEIYDQLEIYINDEGVNITTKEDKIVVTIFTNIKKCPEINFELKKEILDNNQKINILMEKIVYLEKENQDNNTKLMNLESENKENKIKITNLESENNLLKNEIENIKNSINLFNEYIKIQNKKGEEKNIFIGSEIIKKNEEQIISNWITPNKRIKATLLFRASRDGFTPDKFHEYCNNKGPTITFVKIENDCRIGGYSGISWTNDGFWVKDKDSFIFSLDNKLKIVNNNTKYTVNHCENYGPAFGSGGGTQITINNGLKSWSHDKGNCYSFKNKDLIGIDHQGQYFFDVKDYEVYKIEIY